MLWYGGNIQKSYALHLMDLFLSVMHVGKSTDDVHRLIMYYKQSQIIQEWLVLK